MVDEVDEVTDVVVDIIRWEDVDVVADVVWVSEQADNSVVAIKMNIRKPNKNFCFIVAVLLSVIYFH